MCIRDRSKIGRVNACSADIWSDMARIEFKSKCDEVGLYLLCFAIGKVGREGEHFIITMTPKASKEWRGIGTENVPAWY